MFRQVSNLRTPHLIAGSAGDNTNVSNLELSARLESALKKGTQRFSRNELQSLHKGGPPSTKKHAACRVVELLKSVPEEKLTPVAIQTRDQLQQICSKAGGLNVKGKGQRGVVAAAIDTLEQEGLGEYLFAPEVKQNIIGKNTPKINNVQQKSSLEQKIESVFASMDASNSIKKLKSIQKYIRHWSEEASNSDKVNSKVTVSDIKKLQLLKPIVDKMVASSTAKNTPVENNYANSEWHPIVESIWKNIPGNASNINAPPAENNDKEQSALNIPVQNNNNTKKNNNFNREQSALNIPVQNNNFNREQSALNIPVQNNNFNKEQSALNIPVQNNNTKNINSKNITRKIQNIQTKLESILKNMQKISAPAAGGKRSVSKKRKITRRKK
jgi:hypothetical protein